MSFRKICCSFTWIGVQTMFIYAFFYLTEDLGLGDGR